MARAGTVLAAVAAVALSACRAGVEPSRHELATRLGIPSDPAAQACFAHASVDACLADTAYECYWGPNFYYPVTVDRSPCQPAEGICLSPLSPVPAALECTTDAANDAACAAHDGADACTADAAHRCWWQDMVPATPCCPDGTGCGPYRQCFTTADCPPRCWSSGPIIGVGVYGGCGCLNPPGGVCLAPAADPTAATGCAARPACDAADVCTCLTGYGTCTEGDAPNVCVCDGFAG